MAKIRTVKPDLFRHEDLFEAEKKYQLPLRLAFIGLFTCCDREGRFVWRPRALKLDVLPYDDSIDFSKVLDALCESGFIKKYHYEGKYYGCIPSWRHHQAINKREPVSKLPDPAQCIDERLPTSADIVSPPAQAAVITESAVTAADNQNSRTASISQPMAASLPMQETVKATPPAQVPVNIIQQTAPPIVSAHAMVSYSRKQNNQPITAFTPKRQPAASQDVLAIFQHWKTTLNHPQAVLDKRRHRLIQQALQSGYSVTQLCEAINGCALTPHNMGNNERGQRFDGLHIIFGSADQIDRFIGNFKSPPKSQHGLDKRTQSNITHLKNWLEKKIQPTHYPQQEANINGTH